MTGFQIILIWREYTEITLRYIFRAKWSQLHFYPLQDFTEPGNVSSVQTIHPKCLIRHLDDTQNTWILKSRFEKQKFSIYNTVQILLNILVTTLCTVLQGVSSEEEGATRGQQDQAVRPGARTQGNVVRHWGCSLRPPEEGRVWIQRHHHPLAATPPVFPQHRHVITDGHHAAPREAGQDNK